MSSHDETLSDEIIAMMLIREEEEENTRIWMNNNRNLIDDLRNNQRKEEEKFYRMEIEESKLKLQESDNVFNIYENPTELGEFPEWLTPSAISSQVEAIEHQHNPPPRNNPPSLNQIIRNQRSNDLSRIMHNSSPNPRENPSVHINSTPDSYSNSARANPDNSRIPHDRNRRVPAARNIINHRDRCRRVPLSKNRANNEERSSRDEDLGSYESLLELDSSAYDIGNGLDIEIISILPEDVYLASDKANQEDTCFCGNEYVNKDKICRLPCLHFFHTKCIHEWLLRKKTCPICTHEVMI